MKGPWRKNRRMGKREQIANHCVVEWGGRTPTPDNVVGMTPHRCNKPIGHVGKHRCGCGARRD